MGIHYLWNAINTTGKRVYLGDILQDRLARDKDNIMKIGVDMSPFMAECTAALLNSGVHSQPHGGVLSILFHRLCHFITLPVILVFVFDGPNRPPIKRGQPVINNPPAWTNKAKELIQMFGYHVHEAPGEAEAELGALSIHNMIDGVITSDVDALVFGTREMYRRLDWDLTGGYLMFALLSGGDYNTGIEGCGLTVASALARCEYGDRLLQAISERDDDSLKEFLSTWRDTLRLELRNNPLARLNHRAPSIADHISDSFPDLDVVNLYLKPITSWSVVPARVPNPAQWKFTMLSVPRLIYFCRETLGLENDQTLRKKLRNTVWEGVFLQMIYSRTAMYSPAEQTLSIQGLSVRIIKSTPKIRRGRFSQRYGEDPQTRLEILITPSAEFGGGDILKEEKMLIWVPKAFFPGEFILAATDDLKAPGPSTLTRLEIAEQYSGVRNPYRHVIDLTEGEPSVRVHSCAELIDLTMDDSD